MNDVSVVVISYNSARSMLGCLQSLSGSEGLRLTIHVIDNSPSDGPQAILEGPFPSVILTKSPVNLGFAGAANLGIRLSRSDTVILMNPDVTVNRTTLRFLADALQRDPKAAIAGCKLLYPDGKTIQHAGGTLSYPLALANHYGYGEQDQGQYDELREVDYATGAVLAVKKPAIDAIGWFDEGFYPAYFEETDLCYRARQAGYRVLYVPQAVAIHHESETTGRDTFQYYHFYHRNRLRFVLKHYSDGQLWQDFLPAEVQRLRNVGSPEELEALQMACQDNLAVLEDKGSTFDHPSTVASLTRSPKRMELLRTLKDSVAASLARRKEETGMLDDRLLALNTRSQIVEPSFSSSVPLVGPIIVRFRELWNWVSTKWYVRPVIQQQSEFNMLIVDSLRELSLTMRALEATAIDSDRTHVRLNRDFALLELRMRRLEARLAELQNRLEDPK